MAHPYEPQEPKEATNQAGTKTAESEPFPVTITGRVELVESQSSDNREEADAKRADDDLEAQQAMAIAAAVHAVIGFLTLIGLVFTVVYARKAWKEAGRSADAAVKTAEHAKQSVVAADRAAKAAEEAVGVTSSTAKRQLRAYVHIAGGGIEIDPGGQTFTITVHFKNSGQTPAHNLTTRYGYGVLSANQTAFGLPDQREGASFLGPGEAHDILIQRLPVTSPLIEGAGRIFFWGTIDYVDVFDDPQNTGFRFRNGHFFPERNGWSLTPCDEGNEAT